MASAWREGADERITQVLSSEINEKNILTGWVLISTFVDAEGASATAFNVMETQRRTETLGQLLHGLLVEVANVFWDEKPDEQS